MNRVALCCFLIGIAVAFRSLTAGSAHSQAYGGRSAQEPGGLPSSSVGPTEPVITLHGLCDSVERTQKPDPSSCTTIVSREQFDMLVEAMNKTGSRIPPNLRGRLAKDYAEVLTFAQAAREAGLENDPIFREAMRLSRLRTLADLYRRELEEKYRNPTQKEIKDYYEKNPDKFSEVKLRRVFITRNNPSSENKKEFEERAGLVAREIRERAAKGEDLDRLAKEAYSELGLTSQPLNSDLGNRRKGMFPPQVEKDIFALEAGGVTQVEQETTGYAIYKVDAKQTLPLDRVRDEISLDVTREKLENALSAITQSVKAEFNERYFGPSAEPALHPASPVDPGSPRR